MSLVACIIFTGAMGAYFSSIGCRWAHARHRRPSWRYAWLGTLVAVLLCLLFGIQGDLFYPRRWDSVWATVVPISIAGGLVALVASGIVLEVFWRKFKQDRTKP